MNMKKNTETAKIPMINQVLKDAALGHLDVYKRQVHNYAMLGNLMTTF